MLTCCVSSREHTGARGVRGDGGIAADCLQEGPVLHPRDTFEQGLRGAVARAQAAGGAPPAGPAGATGGRGGRGVHPHRQPGHGAPPATGGKRKSNSGVASQQRAQLCWGRAGKSLLLASAAC
eukprot:jgi/Mesen1/3900/ME000208S02911